MYGFICKEKWEADKICLPKDLELVEEVVDYFFCQAVHGCCVIIPVKTEVTVGGFGDLDAVQSVERQVNRIVDFDFTDCVDYFCVVRNADAA